MVGSPSSDPRATQIMVIIDPPVESQRSILSPDFSASRLVKKYIRRGKSASRFISESAPAGRPHQRAARIPVKPILGLTDANGVAALGSGEMYTQVVGNISN